MNGAVIDFIQKDPTIQFNILIPGKLYFKFSGKKNLFEWEEQKFKILEMNFHYECADRYEIFLTCDGNPAKCDITCKDGGT
jgi:hypothetical protein